MTTSLNFLDTTSLVVPTFTPTAVGDYEVNYMVDQLEVEEVPADNVVPSVNWKITDNKIMARDYNYTQGLSPEFYVGGLSGDVLGLDYNIANDDTVKSISVFIDYRTTVGTILLGQIWEYSTGAWLEQVTTDEHVISQEDLGTWITLPVATIDPGDDLLLGGSEYIVAFEFYWNTDEKLWIGGCTGDFHTYSQVTRTRISGSWGWIDVLPMIRLNLAGAIEPPVFKTTNGFGPALNSLCASATIDVQYELDFEVEDPNGLPVTIDTINTPDFVTYFADNGDNTYTLGFDFTGVDTSSTIAYGFELIADNGVSQTTLFFNANVEENAGCEPWVSIDEEAQVSPVNIFPNPTTGILNIENAGNATIFVYNLIGEVVASIQANSAIETIDLNQFAQGTYIVKVVTGNDVVSQKVNLIK